ncbi:homocysteine methyltransferase, partial [Aduncisulcus paluster]
MYSDSGADFITTNTFGANRFKLEDSGYSVEEVITAGVKLAKASAPDRHVALDLGPTGKLLKPMGEMTFDQAYDVFKEQVVAGAKAGADLVIIETMSDLLEAKVALLAAKENSDLPVFVTMTFQENGRTLSGSPAEV